MSKKRKRERFAENETFSHLFQRNFEEINAAPFELKGNWRSGFFDNSNPIVLELGCGKGEYTIGIARRHPELNLIGIDIKGARLWHGCKAAQTENLSNVAFIRTKIQLIEHFFNPDEVDEIWITFPDPQPRSSREKKRLTSPEFLSRYRKIVKQDGIIHLKTDDEQLYRYTLDVIDNQNLKLLVNSDDIYANNFSGIATGIATFYEKIWLSKGLSIKYLQFTLNDGNGK